MLDEPTNHLDVEGVQWLAEHLVSRRSALVVVTHDRWFLDTVATRTWEVVGGGVESYEGGYNDWVFARAERSRQADASEERRRNLARKELAWLRRGAPARTSKPKYRIEAAEALIADVPAPRDAVALASFAQRRLGKVVIELEDARLETPDGRVLVEDLTWRLAPGERVGLVGVNGSGKTTLLRTLAGELEPAAGKRIQGQTVHIGWLKQELDDLPTDMRVLDAVKDVAERITLGDKEVSAGQLAERLGFTPARQRTPVGDLSGGERRRLQLTRVLMAEPNVLLLDEPTNDLDIDTLQQLEDLLDGWAGTMVVISHDRYLIERICDTTWALFGDRKLTNLPGGIEDYLRRRAAMGDGDKPVGGFDGEWCVEEQAGPRRRRGSRCTQGTFEARAVHCEVRRPREEAARFPRRRGHRPGQAAETRRRTQAGHRRQGSRRRAVDGALRRAGRLGELRCEPLEDSLGIQGFRSMPAQQCVQNEPVQCCDELRCIGRGHAAFDQDVDKPIPTTHQFHCEVGIVGMPR